MPGAISPERRDLYFANKRLGMSRSEAARRTGIHRNTAASLERQYGTAHMSGQETRAAAEQRAMGDPIPLDKICDEAKRALSDFAYFQRRYLGRIAIPWQIEAAEEIVRRIESEEDEWAVINCPPGSGKAVALDTPVLTTRGWSTMGEIQVGDQVYDEHGNPANVIWKSPVWHGHDCYRVSTDDGEEIIADAEHGWEAIMRRDMAGAKGRPPGSGRERERRYTTEELFKTPQRHAPSISLCEPINPARKELLADPYALGIWLGDGTSVQANISCPPEDAKWVRQFIEEAGYPTSDYSNPLKFGILGGFQVQLRQLGVLNNKHIPSDYLLGDVEQRMALLQGLIDSDGHVRPDGLTVFSNTNEDLARGVLFLARSMGIKATIRTNPYDDDPTRQPAFSVFFYLEGSARLPRKSLLTRNASSRARRFLKIEPVESVPTQCMTIDTPEHLFLVGHGLVVTHQSTTFSHDIPAWLTVRDRAITGLIGTAVQTNGRLYIENLKATFERTLPVKAHPRRAKLGLEIDAEATLAEDFGRFKPEKGIWSADRFVVEQFDGEATNQKEPTWSCYGRKGGVLGMRYQFVIWDDLVDPDRVDNQELIDEDREWYSDIAESRLEPGGTFILQGQRLGPNDLYAYALKMKRPAEEVDFMTAIDEETEGDVPKYAHIKFRAHYEDHCYGPHELPTGETVYESHLPGAKPYPEGCLLFPRRLGWRKLEPMMRERNERFQIVYQQEDIDPDTVLVHKNWVSGDGGYPGCWDKDRDRLEVPEGVDPAKCVSVVSVDPSPTQYWGITWWLYDFGAEFGVVRYLINLERKGMGANKFLDFIAKTGQFVGLAEEWQNKSYELGIPITQWIIERNGAQQFMLQTDMIQQWQRRHGVRIIPHHTGAYNKNSEEFGVQALIPGPWEQGLVRLPGKASSVGRAVSMKLVEEVTQHPHSRTFDLGMSQWFGEIHLPELTRSGKRREATQHVQENRPAWMAEEYKSLAAVAGVKLDGKRPPSGPEEMMRRFWADREKEAVPA